MSAMQYAAPSAPKGSNKKTAAEKNSTGRVKNVARFDKKARIVLWIGLGALLVECMVIALIWAVQQQSSDIAGSNATNSATEIVAPAPEAISKYTGLGITKKQSEQRAIGVMISGDAVTRPQSGLGVADVVVEMEAAVGITRFMAVMQSVYAKEIGSIRSARNDYIDLSVGLDAVLVHWGGEKKALDRLAATDAAEIDQFVNGDLFYRINSIPGPHNGFTDAKLMQEGVKRYKYNRAPKYSGWVFEQTAVTDPETLKDAWLKAIPKSKDGKLALSYGNPQFDIEYAYEAKRDLYLRTQGGEIHKDAVTDAQISTSNVVVVRANYFTYNAVGGYLQFDVTSGGKCTLFKHGREIPCTWKKGDESKPLQFFGANKKQLELAPGKTWIQVMSPSAPVKWQNI